MHVIPGHTDYRQTPSANTGRPGRNRWPASRWIAFAGLVGAGVTFIRSIAHRAKAAAPPDPNRAYCEDGKTIDVVYEASEDSFPCSDPPAWT